MIPITRDNVKIGIKVIRGPDWKWGNQDHDCHTGKPTFGITKK